MVIVANTMQLGTFPVDKTHYEEVRDALVGFGLTPNQSKVFFYLGKIGAKTASDIAKAVNVPRSETYHLLTALQNKGIVEASFQHPIQFTALPIKKAINLLISTETERLNKLKKSGPVLEEIWKKIPGAETTNEEDEEEKFKVLQGGNQVNSKIFDMILNAKKECRILGSEKDFMKFYHANFLDALEEHDIDYKLLTPISKKSKYIFEDIDKSKIKQLCSHQLKKTYAF
ncbi:TrmB family transcriptional regulator [Nitrosopumilus cobalaminigenes]|uniref:TrmB family transcriptional regulator n=1 Tax=Nitrosopumilus cobalaminigenes TaxID=1470066 RepID=UPI001FEBF82A|nr:helix-turn-helix domain-containing protein [Nitrosopumilus cobalaminigenes]